MATLYDRIKSRRTELGLTVEELAHKMSYKDKSSISKIEMVKPISHNQKLQHLLMRCRPPPPT